MDKTFEDTMKELEEIVAKLEKGDLSLDESVKEYTRGIELSKHAYSLLENAKSKLTIKDEE